jgi:hypothetical protein
VSKKDFDLCLGTHATTIKGLKDVCETNDPSKCRKYFLIHECYGLDWQKEYGEWFDAEALIFNLAPKTSELVAFPKDGLQNPAAGRESCMMMSSS